MANHSWCKVVVIGWLCGIHILCLRYFRSSSYFSLHAYHSVYELQNESEIILQNQIDVFQIEEQKYHGQGIAIGSHSNRSTSGEIQIQDWVQPSPSSSLWIVGSSWAEGIAAWRISITEVVILAKNLNATIVEPGIKDGRLVAPGKGHLSLFQLLDRKQLEKYHSKWATAEEYWNAFHQSDPIVIQWCIAKPSRPDCPAGTTYNPSELIHSPALEQALHHTNSNHSSMVILEMSSIWKRQLTHLRLQSAPRIPLVTREKVDQILRTSLRFSERIYQLADHTLARMNISNNQDYAIIHWRAELEDLDYDQCATDIVQTKAAMSLPKDTPFLLMSTLSMDVQNIWSGARKKASNSTAQTALQNLLHNHSFRKADNVLPQQEDLIMYVAVDLLLAQKATAFSTCTRYCDAPYDSCQRCNHAGNFAELALSLRWEDDEKRSLPCWPRNRSERHAIYNLW